VITEQTPKLDFLEMSFLLWHESGSSRVRFYELLREHFRVDPVFRAAYLAYSEQRLFASVATICARRARRAATAALLQNVR
jgi:hypothetical protein